MALTNLGVLTTVNTLYIPATYTPTPPSNMFITDGVATWERTIKVNRAAVNNADPAVTFGAIITDGTDGISKLAEDIVSDEIDIVGKAVTMFTEFYAIDTNLARAHSATNDLYNEKAAAYLCAVKIYAKVEALPAP